jgi:hypothetical protein
MALCDLIVSQASFALKLSHNSYQLLLSLPTGHAFHFLKVKAAKKFSGLGFHMDVPWRMISDKPLNDVSTATDSTHG